VPQAVLEDLAFLLAPLASVTSVSMSAPSISQQWCVADVAVPFVAGKGLEEEGDGEPIEILEVDMTSRSGSFRWVEEGLGLPARAWRKRSWPFLDELMEELRQRRGALKGKARPSATTLARLDVRGVTVLVRHNIKALKVCFRPESLPESLRSFLAELAKDATKQSEEGGQGQSESPGEAPLVVDGDTANLEADGADLEADGGGAQPEADTCAASRASALEAEWRKAHLETLRQHSNCSSASWAESRPCFVLKRKSSGERLEARVVGLKKVRREAEKDQHTEHLRALQDSYERAMREALRRLEVQESSSAASPQKALED